MPTKTEAEAYLARKFGAVDPRAEPYVQPVKPHDQLLESNSPALLIEAEDPVVLRQIMMAVS